MKSIFIPTAMLLALVIILSGCTKPIDTVSAVPPSSSDTPRNSDYPFSLNNYDREVTVSEKPQRVLTLGPNCTELFVALGLTDYIVGNSLENHSRGPLPEYAWEYAKIPKLSYGSASREVVVSSGADFIYGIDWEFGGNGLDINELSGYGMTTYMNSAATLEQQYQEILDIGRIFGITDKAEAFVEDQKARIKAVEDKVKGTDAAKVLVYDGSNNGVFTCTGINFESLLIGMAGGQNLFGDLKDKAWVTVSYEEILAREPDIIVIHDYDAPSVEEKIAEIKANDILAQLDCVKNERFVIIELESVLPGNRMAYAVEKLARGFYPDLFQ